LGQGRGVVFGDLYQIWAVGRQLAAAGRLSRPRDAPGARFAGRPDRR
jgi:hypothetical protein